MPVESEIYPEQMLVIHTCSGELTADDFIQAFDHSIAHPDFRRGMNVLWDIRDATINTSPRDIQKLVTHVATRREKRGSGYRLAVVSDKSVLLMLAGIFKALATPLTFQVRIHRDIEVARRWLLNNNNASDA
ncbi:MAG TPA: STAS/SEC14 domain-containing protein [Chromatiales bacterium]|nr:STAS/SEC14 domain-containing protein [Chromatiales bacterium]